jgi:1,4-alpha-glucan branching enzyme
VLVVASFNDQPFLNGYVIQSDPSRLPSGLWQETFNSDASIYGGGNVGNFGAAVPVDNGQIQLRLPANGFVVLQRR